MNTDIYREKERDKERRKVSFIEADWKRLALEENQAVMLAVNEYW